MTAPGALGLCQLGEEWSLLWNIVEEGLTAGHRGAEPPLPPSREQELNPPPLLAPVAALRVPYTAAQPVRAASGRLGSPVKGDWPLGTRILMRNITRSVPPGSVAPWTSSPPFKTARSHLGKERGLSQPGGGSVSSGKAPVPAPS